MRWRRSTCRRNWRESGARPGSPAVVTLASFAPFAAFAAPATPRIPRDSARPTRPMPAGTVVLTLLFTDLEGSTRLWE